MKTFFLLILFSAAAVFEISFVSGLFDFSVPVSFWVFAVCLFFLKKEDMPLFGVLAVLFSSVFFSGFGSYQEALILALAAAYWLKTVGGLYRRSAFLLHFLTLILLNEAVRIVAFSFGKYPQNFRKELMLEILLVAVCVVFFGLVTFRKRRPKGYSI
ncbi:MAG: hypothetical protein A3H69_01735 [Candidatus Sungbacteria bacterium RIFCSPLOWO2_02_FULL_47_9]|uniref:Uncharacterized protein n=1 Tax=Candidatus Sungbacteria bacterium RIFCSPHIGHO2_01_FULL_47_32 TaxID=1802264 RepID=A0A1G2K647_9BACT|nr:MAG: hypothetical protein UX72_C0001G0145 [Parcubacteria group bacterium GW2011_GWA2_47_10]OGZ93908.1 MAG: hypothetical protein A2633_05330 [Candidatus Sungbacteria bacterium RIFCSPHIGHO2_01_FULL_47_32]OGZ99160.1 MAG: hypothetical protein A3D57_05380 [Candidatus Sungbacteria bacterium RIFCSPHIGHO2_02_FULL_46_12]OHA06036.1 MAG: hypothetical protein A3A28_05390 [Candidatus Sungbacteria bacterium RIFCSPLOWO2_01_FULL_47_32]OHA09715.1 MAG: hypothetical protein A3H69_01735 [Candidatus Sungbacteria